MTAPADMPRWLLEHEGGHEGNAAILGLDARSASALYEFLVGFWYGG